MSTAVAPELKSKTMRVWIVVLAVWVVVVGGFFAYVGVRYSGYREVQDTGIALMQLVSSEYEGEDRGEVISRIYMDITRSSYLGGDYSDVSRELRNSLGDAIEEALGEYIGYVPSYFRYASFGDYLVSYLVFEMDGTILVFYVLFAAALALTIVYLAKRGGSVTVGEDGVTCGKKGREVHLLYRDVISVKTGGLGSLTIVAPVGKHTVSFLKNGPALRNAIMERKLALEKEARDAQAAQAQAQPAPTAPAGDSAEELKKYKDLLDSGVITQEEFDAKKKQLLGL